MLVLSVIPVHGGLADVPYLDKVTHLCEYALFAWILVQAVRASRMREHEYLLWCWIYATSYGLLIELLQAFIPWRSAELGDVFANTIGAALGVWVGARFPRPLNE